MVKTKLQASEVTCNLNDVLIGYNLFNEIVELLNNLERYDNKVEYARNLIL